MSSHDDERAEEVKSAFVKIGVVIVALAVLVLVGAKLMVSALGLDEGSSTTGGSSAPSVAGLPSTALPNPSDSPVTDPSESSPTAEPTGPLQLTVTPVLVRPMDRINLTGQYPGQDTVTLQVQRQENGAWNDFPVSVKVSMGTFSTFVMTGRSGDSTFRVFDPAKNVASNPVTVTVD